MIERPEALKDCLARRGRLAGRRPRPAAGADRRVPVAASRATDPRRHRRRARGLRRRAARPEPRRTLAGPRAARIRSSDAATRISSSQAAPPTSTGSGACATPASPASSSERPSSPGPSTSHWPWRPPHDQTHPIDPRPRRRAGDRGARARRGVLAAAAPATVAPATLAPSRGADRSVARPRRTGRCPTAQPAAARRRRDRIVTIADRTRATSRSSSRAALSPIAAGNFVALAECGYYDGVVFHRIVPGFVIQGGDGRTAARRTCDPTGSALAAPATRSRTSRSPRPTAAARSRWPGPPQPNSVGSQFFIVLDDGARRRARGRATPTRSSATVTSGHGRGRRDRRGRRGTRRTAVGDPVADRDGDRRYPCTTLTLKEARP